MKILKFNSLYTDSGWLDNAYVSLDAAGKVMQITTTAPQHDHDVEKIPGWAIPGFQNAHSHAFQYLMAGTAEGIPPQAQGDDFWSWREAMYRTALEISPDDMEKIATKLYCEMLRHGYTSVAEFHYLHHDKNGQAYSNIAEMGIRLIQAAKNAGIAITIIPILYQQCDLESASKPEQRRFISKTLNDYWRLHEATYAECKAYARANIGLGIHSIRAVAPENIIELCSAVNYQIPIHMHIAEQMREVEQCIRVLGKRPVEWLLANIDIDQRYNLVHATHMTTEETNTLAAKKANVVLCPSTEGNLGDGFFSLIDFARQGGSYTIGTDSHVGLSPLEELRWLDYGQRLQIQKRNIVCLGKSGESGEILFNQVYRSGKIAMGEWKTGIFCKNEPFDCVVLNAEHPRLVDTPKENRLSRLIYSGDPTVISSVMVSGKQVI